MSARALALWPLIALLGACAGAPGERAPVCDGRHRRPANLQGSVLAPALGAGAGAPTPGPAADTPQARREPVPKSSAGAGCGGRP